MSDHTYTQSECHKCLAWLLNVELHAHLGRTGCYLAVRNIAINGVAAVSVIVVMIGHCMNHQARLLQKATSPAGSCTWMA